MSAEMEVGAKRCGVAVSSNLAGEPGTRPKPEFEIHQPGQNQIAKKTETRLKPDFGIARPGLVVPKSGSNPATGFRNLVWTSPSRPSDSQIPNVAGRAPPRRPRRTRFQVKPGSEIRFEPEAGTFEPGSNQISEQPARFRNLVQTRFRKFRNPVQTRFRNFRTWFKPDFGTVSQVPKSGSNQISEHSNLVQTRFRNMRTWFEPDFGTEPGSEIWL